MLVVRALTVLVAGVVTFFALKRILGEHDAAKVKVRAEQPGNPRKATRLRQDPRTGVYYPEE